MPAEEYDAFRAELTEPGKTQDTLAHSAPRLAFEASGKAPWGVWGFGVGSAISPPWLVSPALSSGGRIPAGWGASWGRCVAALPL